MNLVDQIFEQAKAGSAQGQGFGQFFAEGVSVGQRQQQINQQQQQLAMEIAQAPLKQTLLQQRAQMNAADLDLLLRDRQAEANATEAFAGLRSQVDPLIESGNIDQAQDVIIKAGANNGFLLADPKKRLHSLFDMTTKAQDAKLELLKAKAKPTDPTLIIAQDTADLKARLRASEAATSQVAEVTPELSAELERQQQLKDQIAVMDEKTKERTGQSSSATINEKRITELEKERDDYIASGNVVEAQKSQEHINFIKSQHRDPDHEAKLADVRNRKGIVYRELIQTRAGTTKYKDLQKRMDDLDEEMRQLTIGAKVTATSSTNAPAGPKKLRWTPQGLVPIK